MPALIVSRGDRNDFTVYGNGYGDGFGGGYGCGGDGYGYGYTGGVFDGGAGDYDLSFRLPEEGVLCLI